MSETLPIDETNKFITPLFIPDNWSEIYEYNDGGRSKSKYKKQERDCVIRAFAIVFNLDYDLVHDAMQEKGRKWGSSTKKTIWKSWIKHRGKKMAFPAIKDQKRLTSLGFCQKYTKGRFVVQVAGHLFAVIDGKIHDRGMPRLNACVYAAWEAYPRCVKKVLN